MYIYVYGAGVIVTYALGGDAVAFRDFSLARLCTCAGGGREGANGFNLLIYKVGIKRDTSAGLGRMCVCV